jgi:hypothetical protein
MSCLVGLKLTKVESNFCKMGFVSCLFSLTHPLSRNQICSERQQKIIYILLTILMTYPNYPTTIRSFCVAHRTFAYTILAELVGRVMGGGNSPRTTPSITTKTTPNLRPPRRRLNQPRLVLTFPCVPFWLCSEYRPSQEGHHRG